MPSQVTPISQIDQIGLIYDRPAASLPPNAFSDALNVRFQDGTIRKMQGEVNIFPNIFDDSGNLIGGIPANYDGSSIKYVVFWPNPNIIRNNSGYYLVITEEIRLVADDTVPPPANVDPVHLRDVAYLVTVDGTSKVEKGTFTPVNFGKWQHTFFQGGFALIVNNGVDKPAYILDSSDNTNINNVPSFLDLPGWDSYNVNRIALQDEFNPATDSYVFDLGQNIDFDANELIVQRINENDTSTVIELTAKGDTGADGTANNPSFVPPDYTTIGDSPWNVADEYEIYYDSETGSVILNFPSNLSSDGVDTILVTISSRNPVTVTAGVIRAFGDFIVAGDLVERDETDNSVIIRSLPGVIRTSDVAAPGAMPNNWNPYASGVSTADEFIVSETDPVKDMVEMQGNMYIYTSNNISVLRRTQNPSIPITISSVTDSYGCQATNAVLEFEGKHVVVGSKDVYLFAGNPSGVQSVANDRVRRYLFDNLNAVNSERLFILDHKQREEIWICYPSNSSADGLCNEALIWSYRMNTWTRRTLRGVVAGIVAPIPGGGLPEVSLTMTGSTGDNGVTHVGAYEVRTMGLDPAVGYVPSSNLPIFAGDPDILVYSGDGNNTWYTQFGELIYPILRVQGPEGIDFTVELSPDGNGHVQAADMWDQLQTAIEANCDGWTFATLPTGYTQETGTVRLIATEDGVGAGLDGMRTVANTPFTVTIYNPENLSETPDFIANFGFKESTVESDIYGVTVSGSVNDYRGSYVLRATPTIAAFRFLNENKTGGEEMIFVSLGGTGTYDPATHTGTNGDALSADEAKDAILAKLAVATTSVVASDAGLGSLGIVPAGFASASGILESVRINDNPTDAAWIWSKYQSAVAGSIFLNPFSDAVYVEPTGYNTTAALEVASNAPSVAGSLDTQFTPDGSRTPDRSGSHTPASLGVTLVENSVYDVDRPWRTTTINTGREFPVFASRHYIEDLVAEERILINKIVAADIGWSYPAVSQTPRTETIDSELSATIVTNNDAPTAYESYVERKQFNVTPDLDVESIKQFFIWSSGEYTPYLNGNTVRNRLQLRLKPTNNPGENVSLETITGGSSNYFFVSESYKCDLRTTGRYLNLRITDNIVDADGNVLPLTSNTKKATNTVFSQSSLWEISGLQPEIRKGGGR